MDLRLKNISGVLLPVALLVSAGTVNATCWKDASRTYGIPEDVLMAIAKTESNFNPDAKNVNKNGSVDIGLMQINSDWLPELNKYDISRKDLESDACLNLKVGAWILSNNVKRLGWNWDAIGAYNVGCKKLSPEECQTRRGKYAWKVHAAMQKIDGLSGSAPVARTKRTWEPVVAKQAATPKIIVVSMNTEKPEDAAPIVTAAATIEEDATQGFFFYEGKAK